MKISVITVTYNCVTTIKKTIENVLAQGYKELEYIIIDGGSTDGTVDIIKEYSDRIAFWCSERDKGIYDAMNKGIMKSTGEFVSFMNSGDWYEQGALSSVTSCAKENYADVIYGNYTVVDEKGRQTIRILDDWNIEELYYKWPMCHQAIFFRRNLFDTIGLYDLGYRIASDYEWILRAYSKGMQFVHLAKSVCCYTLGGFSAMNEKECIQELRRARISWIPKGDESKYLPLIECDFESGMNSLCIKDIKRGIEQGDNLIKEKMRNILLPFQNRSVIFGAGAIGKRYIDFFCDLEMGLTAVMDNNLQLYGTEFQGIRVQKPLYLRDYYVIVAVKNRYCEIFAQLHQLGYEKEKIVYYVDLEKYITREWMKE